MKKVGLLYDDIYLEHKNPEGHPERSERLVSIMATLKGAAIWDNLIQISPRKATTEELAKVHSIKHIANMEKLVGYADPDTYVSKGSYEAALYASGAILEAIDQVKSDRIQRAFCAVRPPGHHAEAGRAMGFCLFNNVAVGARYAQQQGYEKVFIVDFDVHHGNGTEHMFQDDPTVFYFSTHQFPHYPGTGAQHDEGKGDGIGTTANYPMSAGSGDSQYQTIYNETLHTLVGKHDPDIILVSAGYDILATDPLAQIRISHEGIRQIVGGILGAKDVPVIFTLEGGYDIKGLAESVLITIEMLLSK